jgi:hypothetical protein
LVITERHLDYEAYRVADQGAAGKVYIVFE